MPKVSTFKIASLDQTLIKTVGIFGLTLKNIISGNVPS